MSRAVILRRLIDEVTLVSSMSPGQAAKRWHVTKEIGPDCPGDLIQRALHTKALWATDYHNLAPALTLKEWELLEILGDGLSISLDQTGQAIEWARMQTAKIQKKKARRKALRQYAKEIDELADASGRRLQVLLRVLRRLAETAD